METKAIIEKTSEGCYKLNNIKIDTLYTITHNRDEEPFMMENKKTVNYDRKRITRNR